MLAVLITWSTAIAGFMSCYQLVIYHDANKVSVFTSLGKKGFSASNNLWRFFGISFIAKSYAADTKDKNGKYILLLG